MREARWRTVLALLPVAIGRTKVEKMDGRRRLLTGLLTALLCLTICRDVPAQIFIPDDDHFELSDAVDIKDLPNEAATHLARADALIVGEKWDEAIETLRQVAQEHGRWIIQLSDRRYVNVRDYCHLRLSALPAEALDLYRRRVDVVAEAWYRDGVARRDEALLRRVVEQTFCSSYGDDALLALGDLALERGDYSTARYAWERIGPQLRLAGGFCPWSALYGIDLDEHWPEIEALFKRPERKLDWLVYPDTDLPVADLRARLALASILEGAHQRAALELEILTRLHPDAEGYLAGREGKLASTLTGLLETSRKWPAAGTGDDWPTFAGSPQRTHPLASAIDLPARPAWQLKLADLMPGLWTKNRRATSNDEPRRRGAEGDLGFHPLIVGELVLLCNSDQIFALNARTGRPAFGGETNAQIHPGGRPGGEAKEYLVRSPLSEPRYTMTVYGDKLYARTGSQVTNHVPGFAAARNTNRLVCLDLRREGAFNWQYPRDENDPEYAGWAFEGPPVSDGDGVYVAMRRTDARPQAHIACFDPETGRLRWRRKICTADTPAHGRQDEMTHTLLTLAEGTLYYNTNLGAVAAVSADDGLVQWVYQYPRAGSGDLSTPPAHFYRDLNPCIFFQGLVIVAPSDSDRIFALDAGTGILVWRSAPMDMHPVHLLGVGNGNLIATGKSVWWLNAVTGRVSFVWPEPGNRDAPHGYGRGLLAGGRVYWPTREEIYVFDQRVYLQDGQRYIAQQPPINLTRPDIADDQQATGGNLVVGGNMLLIATSDKLFAYDLSDR